MSQPTSPADRPEKVELRRQALRRRSDAHARNATEAAELVCRLGTGLISHLPGSVISAYLPIRDELSPLPLAIAQLASGRRLALPVIKTKWSPLTFLKWHPGDRLVAVEFGLKEPAPEAEPLLPDILLVPLAAFDAQGYRIGYGGGYYDRTLSLYRARRRISAVGIAYDCQEVPAFSHELHDQPLDHLITPSGVRSFGN